jgi:hypothetical protein
VTPEVRKVALFFGTTLLVGLAAVVMAPRFLGVAAGPEADLVAQLARTERDGMTLSLRGIEVPLTSKHHHFDRIVVQVDLQSRTAEASSTLDFTGALGGTEVSSLGVEKTRFAYAGKWQPADGWAPRLAAVVMALEDRRRALEQGDVHLLAAVTGAPAVTLAPDDGLEHVFSLQQRRYQAKAWYIRLDRDSAAVTEEFRLTGVLPDRPFDEEGRRSLTLERRDGEFFFSKGLM